MRNELKVLRATRALSQGQLAIAVRVSRQTIYMVENDRCTPSLALAFSLARFFDRLVEEMFHDDCARAPGLSRFCT